MKSAALDDCSLHSQTLHYNLYNCFQTVRYQMSLNLGGQLCLSIMYDELIACFIR